MSIARLVMFLAMMVNVGCQSDSSILMNDVNSDSLCLGSCPYVKRGNILVERPIYHLSNNPRTKFADWVAYRVGPSSIGPSQPRVWRKDPDLPDSATLEPADYQGASRELETDRGHQVPLASFSNTSSWEQLNYLSNITPQSLYLNRGAWKILEQKVRDMTLDRYRYTWVLTGPVYEKRLDDLPEADESHRIPSGYWKVIAILRDDMIETVSFFFDQNTPADADPCDYSVDLSLVNYKTRLDLLEDVTLNISSNGQDIKEDLGCNKK
tara:strand:+ start:1159 stop:1959 length:801 start_codon:yes stop_codon:yes gene_type:complete